MDRAGVAAAIVAASLVTVGAPQLVVGTHALGWNLDAETGVEWRWVDGDELKRSPWPGDAVNAIHDYGNLSEFETSETVNITVVANGTVIDLTFSYTGRSYTGTFVTTGPNRATVSENLTGRIYRAEPPATAPADSTNWTAVKIIGGGFAASAVYDGDSIDIVENSPGFDLDDDVEPKDLVSIVAESCTDSSTNDSVNLQTASGTDSCPGGYDGDDLQVISCDSCTPTPYDFYYSGSIPWCNDHGQGWSAVVEEIFDASVSTFDDTNAEPKFGGAVCWFTDDNNFDHGTDYYHCHDDDGDGACDGNQEHPYPYNEVTADHECQKYMNNFQEDLNHAQGHGAGVSGDNLQVLHEAACTVGGDAFGGYADIEGSHSIATENAWAGGEFGEMVSAHEFGHNFGADEDRAECPTDDSTTIMGDTGGDTGCVDGDEERLTQFSVENIDQVDDCVENDCS